MSLTRAQKNIRAEMFAALATIVGVASIAIYYFGADVPQDPFFVWGKCALVILGWLIAAIAVRASERYFHMEEIEGASPVAGSASDINARVLQNTLEQTIVVLTVSLVLVCLQPAYWYGLLLALTGLFCVGRAMFWIGYHRRPSLRGYGFSLTFHSSVGVFFYVIVTSF